MYCFISFILTHICLFVNHVLRIMKTARRNKCSEVVELETNCLVAEYHIPYRIGPRTIIITHAHSCSAPLIDGLGHATWSAT